MENLWRAMVLTACVFVAGCVAPSAANLADTDYKGIVARSLYYTGNEKPKKSFSISDPWMNLVGGMAVCVRENTPDGRGGFAMTGIHKMYELRGQNIEAVTVVSSGICVDNQTYKPLTPA